MKTVSLLRQRFPLGGVLMAAMAGILLASWFGPTRELIIGLFVLLLFLIPFHARGGLVLAFTVVCFAMLQLWCWNDAPARRLAFWFDAHPMEFNVLGIVVGEPRMAPSGAATFPMRAERITGPENASVPITLSVPVQVRWEGSLPAFGDRVSFSATAERASPPRNPGGFDYPVWLARHGIYTQLRIDPGKPGSIISHGQGNPIMAWAIASRHRMETILATDMQAAPMELSAIKGITLGVTENAPEGFTDDFRFTGTMHLFAVSGLHVGMLAVMIWFVFMAARVPRSWAVAIIIPILFFYVAVTGLKSGSIRSASMVSLLLIGSVFYRRSPSLNTLAAAALLQLAFDPNALFSAGWQFSYCVVFAILVMAPPLEEMLCKLHAPDSFMPPKLLTAWERWRFSAWKHLAGLLAVSSAAWVGSLIPTIAYFHLISLSAIWANLLAVPLAFAVLALGSLSLVTGGVSLWVAGAFNNANWLVAKFLLLIVQSSALLPGGHWFVGPAGNSCPTLTLLDLGGASCAVVQSGGQCALVNAGRKRDAVRDILPFLESRGVNSIGNILITKPDAAHLGGVPVIAREVPVARLGIVDEKTRSVVAKKVMNSFASKVTVFEPGISLPLLRGVTAEVLFQTDNSSALLLRMGENRIIILSKLTPEVKKQLLSTPKELLRAEVLVMPLGGVDILSTLQLINKIVPGVIVSPVDHLQREGVPSREWDCLLEKEGIEFLRQDETGAVIINACPKGMKVRQFLPKIDHASTDCSDGR